MFKKTLLPLALTLLTGAANAGIITNDTDVLTGDGHTLLSEWLGYDFDLTRIFAKGIDGHDSYDWHASVDGKGATFTVMELFDKDTNERRVIGGYSDISWQSSGGHQKVEEAFLFNLTDELIFEKNDRIATGGVYHGSNYGVLFGGGGDLIVNNDLTSGKSKVGYTYGTSLEESYRNSLAGSYDNWKIGGYETFTLSEPTDRGEDVFVANVYAAFLLGGLGLLALIVSYSKKTI